jgi:hypothetical protein
MNAEIYNRLLQQPALLKDVSIEELKQLTDQFPWFGNGQFLLAAKMKQNNHASAEEQLQKAALYSNQSLWFNLQLKRFSQSSEQSSIHQTKTSTAFVHEKIFQQTEPLPETADELAANDTDAMLDAEASIEVEEMKDELAAPITDAVLNAEVLIEADATKEEDAFIKETEIQLNAEALIEAAESNEELLPTVEKTDKEEPFISFEPFHTVDYFASQGIKLQDEKVPQDKLGEQVKSFTQWLRSMKKIYVEEKKELDPTREQAVVSIATESNQPTEVMTETMADVLIKQGKLSQAIDLYRKLSLLHPEKSVYFASRIKELNS